MCAESSCSLWGSTDTKKAPTQMPQTLGRDLCDSSCPGYLQPLASKGCNAAHKFVAKCISVIQGFLRWKKFVLHSGYHSNNTWCFHRAREPREPQEQSHPCSAEGKAEAPGKSPSRSAATLPALNQGSGCSAHMKQELEVTALCRTC